LVNQTGGGESLPLIFDHTKNMMENPNALNDPQSELRDLIQLTPEQFALLTNTSPFRTKGLRDKLTKRIKVKRDTPPD